jgi:hypothetical protein
MGDATIFRDDAKVTGSIDSCSAVLRIGQKCGLCARKVSPIAQCDIPALNADLANLTRVTNRVPGRKDGKSAG